MKKSTTAASTIRTTALRTLDIEIEALGQVRSLAIDADFCRFTEAVFASHGRLVVTGVGKSAIVAQKIVATLNSTGTPALFLHAADALHGDLGMVQPADLLLCLSKSGGTPEMKVLVPLVKNRGNPIAAMTANPSSWLARQADFVLHTPVPQEAGPDNLAPTASTTAQMALGDALAMSLLALRGFSNQDFAQFHPGGSLGRQLYLRVCDIYPHHSRPAVPPAAGIRQVIVAITSGRLGCTVVEDPAGVPLGIITDGDLRRMLEHLPDPDFSTLTAAGVMTARPKTIVHDALAVQALALMRQHSITQLVAVELEKYVGIVHLHDLIREGLV